MPARFQADGIGDAIEIRMHRSLSALTATAVAISLGCGEPASYTHAAWDRSPGVAGDTLREGGS
jgi:hypothetical protein